MQEKKSKAGIFEITRKNRKTGQYVTVEYATIPLRIRQWRKDCPLADGWGKVTEIVNINDKRVVLMVKIIDPEGRIVSCGIAEEMREEAQTRKNSRGEEYTVEGVNVKNAVENCESSAFGRALEGAGYLKDYCLQQEEETAKEDELLTLMRQLEIPDSNKSMLVSENGDIAGVIAALETRHRGMVDELVAAGTQTGRTMIQLGNYLAKAGINGGHIYQFTASQIRKSIALLNDTATADELAKMKGLFEKLVFSTDDKNELAKEHGLTSWQAIPRKIAAAMIKDMELRIFSSEKSTRESLYDECCTAMANHGLDPDKVDSWCRNHGCHLVGEWHSNDDNLRAIMRVIDGDKIRKREAAEKTKAEESTPQKGSFPSMDKPGWWREKFPVTFLLQFCHHGTGKINNRRRVVNFEWIATIDEKVYSYTHRTTDKAGNVQETVVEKAKPRMILHHWLNAGHRGENVILAKYAAVLLNEYYPKQEEGTYADNAQEMFDAVHAVTT